MSKFEITLKKYIKIFLDQETYFANDLKNIALFQKFPLNANRDDVRTKLSAINDSDLVHHDLQDAVIAHIINSKIDDRLKRGDLTVVEDIATISANGKHYRLLHFASVYCNFHRPDVFPIYSEEHIEFYKQYIKENKLALDPEKINTYDVFSKMLNHLVDKWGMSGKLNYLQLRKFGWLYAEAVVKEAT